MDEVDRVLTRIGEIEGVDFAFCIDLHARLLAAADRVPTSNTTLLAYRARGLEVEKLFRGECIVVEADDAEHLPRVEIHPVARRVLLIVAIHRAAAGSPPDPALAPLVMELAHAVGHLPAWTAADLDDLFTTR